MAALRRPSRFVLLAALACAMAGAPLAVHAQTPEDLARARTLFSQALSLEAAGDWAAALAKFEQVAKVKLTPQVRFHIGVCKENLGRFTEALGDYRIAEHEATEQGSKDAEQMTRAREALEQKLPKLVIRLGARAARARVQLDGVDVGAAKLGREIPVDPGTHAVVARLRDGRKVEQSIEIAEGEKKEVEIVAPPKLADDDDEPPEDEPAEGDDAERAPGPVQPPPADDSTMAVLPWLALGVGVGGFAAAGWFWSQRNDADAKLGATCRAELCPERLEPIQQDGERYALYTNIAAGVGVAGAVTAVVLLIAGSGPEEKPPAAARRGVRVSVEPGRIGVRGAF
ncbi:MAG: hypothetical protein IT376_06555 [Polyangiaceae bacterium]|nr:hypothetical protein [Polyangiaceae bacterium]